MFATFRNRHGRHASEADADVTVRLPIDHHICGDIDVGAVEVLEFAFPVFLLKRDEYGAQHALAVERRVRTASPSAGAEWGKVLTVGRRKRESLPLRGAVAARENRAQVYDKGYCDE